MRVLVTGGAGFIGSNFIRRLLQTHPDTEVINLDALSLAGVKKTVDELDELSGHRFVHGDIRDAALLDEIMPGVEAIVHFAAESHVDRSIENPLAFLSVNVLGTAQIANAALHHEVGRFVYVSTDEVYGDVEAPRFAAENAPLDPSSPYSASKTGAEHVVRSYRRTYGLPAIVTRCSNNYGPYQFPEKAIPLFITNAMEGRDIPVYGDGLQQRDWLWVGDHCEALLTILASGEVGETYNIGSGVLVTSSELAARIVALMGKDPALITTVADRAGHDRRYAIDSSKLEALGWSPSVNFDEGLQRTIDWYLQRRDWWEPLTVPAR